MPDFSNLITSRLRAFPIRFYDCISSIVYPSSKDGASGAMDYAAFTTGTEGFCCIERSRRAKNIPTSDIQAPANAGAL